MHRFLTLLVFVAMATAVLPGVNAQEPPYPADMDGTFQVRNWRVGDAGVYSESLAQDVGDGFKDVGLEAFLMRFEFLPKVKVPTAEAPAVDAYRLRMEHADFTQEDTGRAVEHVDVNVGLDGRGSIGLAQTYEGSSPMSRLYMGRWGDLPCGFRTALQDGPFALGYDASGKQATFYLPHCKLRGASLEGHYEPVAKVRLGNLETVVFHQSRQGVDHGESWIWFAPDYPLPVAFILQDAARPQVFHIYRLTNFRAGAGEPAQWREAAAGLAWPDPELKAWPDHGPALPAWVGMNVSESLQAAYNSTDGAGLQHWFSAHDEVLTTATFGDAFTGADGATQEYAVFLGFRDGAEYASVRVTRTTEPVHVDLLGFDPFVLVGQPTPEPLQNRTGNKTTYDVAITLGTFADCDCDDLRAFRSIPLPSPDALLQRWDPLRGPEYQDAEPNHFSFERGWCADNPCTKMDYEINVGRWFLDDQRSSGGAVTFQVSLLSLSATSDPDDGSSMLMDEFHPVVAPVIGAAPPFAGLVSASRLLQSLQDNGLMGRESPPATEAAPAQEALPATPIGDQETMPSRSRPQSAAIPEVAVPIASTLTALTVLALAWLALSKSGILAVLFSRIQGARLLEHPVRAHLHALIEAQPGIHFSALVRASQRPKNVVRHHLEKLVQGNLVAETVGVGHTTYMVPGAVAHRVQQAAPIVASPVRRRVLRAVVAAPGATFSGIANRVGLAPATVTYHVKQLSLAGLIEVQRAGKTSRLSATSLGVQALRDVVRGGQ